MLTTTKDIIKFLPLDEEFKSYLLERYDELTPDQRFLVEQAVWGAYDAIYKMRLEENIQEALDKARDNETELDENFYNRVKKQTEEEMNKESVENVNEANIDAAREKLQDIIEENEAIDNNTDVVLDAR